MSPAKRSQARRRRDPLWWWRRMLPGYQIRRLRQGDLIAEIRPEMRDLWSDEFDVHMAASAARAAEDLEADTWIRYALDVMGVDASELRRLFADQSCVLRRLDERGIE